MDGLPEASAALRGGPRALRKIASEGRCHGPMGQVVATEKLSHRQHAWMQVNYPPPVFRAGRVESGGGSDPEVIAPVPLGMSVLMDSMNLSPFSTAWLWLGLPSAVRSGASEQWHPAFALGSGGHDYGGTRCVRLDRWRDSWPTPASRIHRVPKGAKWTLSNHRERRATGGAAEAVLPDPEEVALEAPGETDGAEEQVEQVIQQAGRIRGDVWARHADRGARGRFRWGWSSLRGGAAAARPEARQGVVVGGVVPEGEAPEWTFGIHWWAWARRACTDGYGQGSGIHAGGGGGGRFQIQDSRGR